MLLRYKEHGEIIKRTKWLISTIIIQKWDKWKKINKSKKIINR